MKQVDGVDKKKPDKPKRNDTFAKSDKPKRADDQPKPEKPKRIDDNAKPATNGTFPSKKRGSRTKSKEFAEFGNVKPKLLVRDSKNTAGRLP